MIYGQLIINDNAYKIMAYGYCYCGCGGKTEVPKYYYYYQGRRIKGHLKYIKGHNGNSNICPECKQNERGYFPSGKKRDYCPICANKKTKARHIKKGGKIFKLCESCGKPFITDIWHPKKKYCSVICYNYEYGLKNPEQVKQYKIKYEEKKRIEEKKEPIIKICPVCGHKFSYNGWPHNKTFCSKSCAYRHYYYIDGGKFKQLLLARRASFELQDHYVKAILTHRTNLSAKDIPVEIVSLQRALLMAKRLLKEKECFYGHS